MYKILFAASEAHPLVKTGGLGDVAGALPIALKELGQDARLVLPAYRDAVQRLDTRPAAVATLNIGPDTVHILEGTLPGTEVTVWWIDAPAHFDRPGNPYVGPDGHDWPDNAARYAAYARAVVEIAQDRAGLGWRPDVVHCHDWQTGLVPALLSLETPRPATVFTIHNLSYQGVFPAETYWRLQLPPSLWSMHGLEYYGNCSYIKGGLAYADMLSTVSPAYAREILTPAYGYGLEGLLNARVHRLAGILNGVNYGEWNPAHDPHLSKQYTSDTLDNKAANKAALQAELGLPVRAGTPLIGMIGRLVEQKGVDLVLDALPGLLTRGVQIALLGSGERAYEQRWRDAAARHPDQIAIYIGFGEPLAHRIEAGADMFLMPSRFEPCGLNQIFSLRYGTVPIVRHTGGLADTVVNTTPETLADNSATGLSFDAPNHQALLATVDRALKLYHQPDVWRQLMRSGMSRDYSWHRSAQRYVDLYHHAIELISR